MSLFDPTFIKFDGSPDTGRIPTAVSVVGGQELTRAQQFGVDQAYGLFRAARRVSITPFHAEGYVLSDGTKVHIWSLQNRDEVVIEPAPSTSEATELPHGFAVATNWQATLIYRRDLNDGLHWLLGPTAPQIQDVSTVNYDNQVFRKDIDANEYFNLPLVHDYSNQSLWDYKLRAAPEVDGTPAVPFLMEFDDQFTFELPHYLVENTVVDSDGVALYTMTDQAPILAPGHPDYPESVHYWPGHTDAKGVQAGMQAMRFTVISPSSNIWMFRIWNERIHRTAAQAYALLERNAFQITTPWGKQTVTTLFVDDGALGEDPRTYFKFKPTFVLLPGAYTGGGSGRLYKVGWAGPEQWWDLTGIPLSIDATQALREIKEQSSGAVTFESVLAAPNESIGYIDIRSSLNYPATVFWRGGTSTKAYTTDLLKAFVGIPVWGSLPLNYRADNVTITRFDTKYEVDGAPDITAELGWKSLKLLEGSTTGRMTGKEYVNQISQMGTYPFIDATWSYTWITTEIKTSSDFPFHPYDQYYWDWMDAANVKDEYYDDYLAYGTLPHGAIPAPNPTTKYEYLHDERPENTVDYNLISRYVIDYDHKGRFYAAIRCEVVCSGAEWEENLAYYKGYMQVKTHPTYTVRIWFECQWGGVGDQLLLVEETATRPCFEAITISKFNPWYWPYPVYYDRDCKVRTPPEPTPDENFMMMFQNLASHQGVNTNLCCADVRPDITGADATKAISTDGVEYSYEEDGVVTPHTKFVTGQLYARTFKLSDFYEALWMLRQLKVNATQDDIAEDGGPGGTPRPGWYYHPVIKAALEVDRHIEVRDGVIVQWSDDITGVVSGYPPTPAAPPAPVDRQIKLYRV